MNNRARGTIVNCFYTEIPKFALTQDAKANWHYCSCTYHSLMLSQIGEESTPQIENRTLPAISYKFLLHPLLSAEPDLNSAANGP